MTDVSQRLFPVRLDYEREKFFLQPPSRQEGIPGTYAHREVTFSHVTILLREGPVLFFFPFPFPLLSPPEAGQAVTFSYIVFSDDEIFLLPPRSPFLMVLRIKRPGLYRPFFPEAPLRWSSPQPLYFVCSYREV